MVSIYFDTLNLLPLNIGYGQMVYSLSFQYFSLPAGIALTIVTLKQISHVILIFLSFYFLFWIKK